MPPASLFVGEIVFGIGIFLSMPSSYRGASFIIAKSKCVARLCK